MINWRTHKAIAFGVMAFVALGLLGVGGISLEDKLFNLIQWKYALLACVGYLAWVFKKVLNM